MRMFVCVYVCLMEAMSDVVAISRFTGLWVGAEGVWVGDTLQEYEGMWLEWDCQSLGKSFSGRLMWTFP